MRSSRKNIVPFREPTVFQPSGAEVALINKIDELLEKFIGIRDLDLSTTMHKLALTATEPEVFAGLLDRDLSDFEFPDDFVLDVCVTLVSDLLTRD